MLDKIRVQGCRFGADGLDSTRPVSANGLRVAPGRAGDPAYMYLYIYLYLYMSIYASISISIYICIYIYIYIYRSMHVYIYIYIYTQIFQIRPDPLSGWMTVFEMLEREGVDRDALLVVRAAPLDLPPPSGYSLLRCAHFQSKPTLLE